MQPLSIGVVPWGVSLNRSLLVALSFQIVVGCGAAEGSGPGGTIVEAGVGSQAERDAGPPTCGPRQRVGGVDVCLDPEARDYFEAARNCRTLGGRLFEIEGEMTNAYFAQAFTSSWQSARSFWIGVFRGDETPWELAHARVPPPIVSWAPGEPNDAGGNERCVETLLSGGWNDLFCGSPRPFLCEEVPNQTFRCRGEKLEGLGCARFDPRVFVEAKFACEEDGGRLLTVDTAEEEELLEATLGQRSGDVWFGLSDLAEEGTWKTERGVTPRFDAWRPGEPNDAGEAGEDCAAVGLHDAAWNDLPCDVKTRSLCQLPPR